MSKNYDNYLTNHITNVERAADWIRHNLPDVWGDSIYWDHDSSKYTREEYFAYDDYFYGRRTKAVQEAFNEAWLHHIHNNPHHWQHWVLINDEPGEGIIALRMPRRYVLEMICDWWAFSWAKDNLYEIFNWYDDHKKHMKLHVDTRELVEEILDRIKTKLDEDKAGDVE